MFGGRNEKMKKVKFDYYNLLRVSVAIAVSIIIACTIIIFVSDQPSEAIFQLFLGPLQSKRNFFTVIESMIPLVFTGLAMNIMFKGGLFSMAADGAFYMGAVVAAFIAIKFTLPSGVHQFVLILFASLVGGIITIIPALIKKKTGASELVVSLMSNYVFFYSGLYIINKFLLDETTGYASYKFKESARLGLMVEGTRLHYGFLIMIAVVIVMYFVIERSKFGYNLRITGKNKRFAKYSGVGITGTILSSQFIGGCLAGMGGAIEMVGIYKRFEWNRQVAYVWDGMLVDLLASSKPALIPFAAFFLSYIRTGADIMSRRTNVDNEIVAIIQGVMILLVAAERFMYSVKKRKEERQALEDSEKSIV